MAKYKYANNLTSPFCPISRSTVPSYMIFPNVNFTNARLISAYRLQNTSAEVDVAADSQSRSMFFLFLNGFGVFCWTAMEKLLMAKIQSIVVYFFYWVLARLQRLGQQWRTRPTANEAPRNLVTDEQASPAQTTSPRKASWSYLRGLCAVPAFRRAIVTNRACVGVSLALSELCQDGNYGGDRIPLPVILDLSTLYIPPSAA